MYFIQIEKGLMLQHILSAFQQMIAEPVNLHHSEELFERIVQMGEEYRTADTSGWWEREIEALDTLVSLFPASPTVYLAPFSIPAELPATWARLLQGFSVSGQRAHNCMVSPLALLWLHEIGAKCADPFPATVQSVEVAEGVAILHLKKSEKIQTECKNHQDEHIDESMLLVQANLDDASPEWIGYAMEQLFGAGANDVTLMPIIMKKSRQASMIQVLCYHSSLQAIKEILFTETTTFGLRYFPVACHRLARQFHKVTTIWGEVSVKIGYLANQRVQVSPEYAKCAELARANGVSLKSVYQAAVELATRETPIHSESHYSL